MDQMNKEQFKKIVEPISIAIWQSPRDTEPIPYFTNQLVEKLLPQINTLLQQAKAEERERCIKKLEPLDKKYACGCYSIAIKAIRED